MQDLWLLEISLLISNDYRSCIDIYKNSGFNRLGNGPTLLILVPYFLCLYHTIQISPTVSVVVNQFQFLSNTFDFSHTFPNTFYCWSIFFISQTFLVSPKLSFLTLLL